MKKNFIA
jgi:hypothetical protein